MSAASVHPGGAPYESDVQKARLRRRFGLMRSSPRVNGGVRRVTALVAIALVVFVIGARAWNAADIDGIEASRASLETVQRRLAQTDAAIAALPALRAAATLTLPLRPSAARTAADDVQTISQLATHSGVTLHALEPGAPIGADAEVSRPIRMTAQAGFAQLIALLHGLSDLPMLVVPDEISVGWPKVTALGQRGDTLAIAATLHVFGALRAVSAASETRPDDESDDADDAVFYNPFSAPRATVTGIPAALNPPEDWQMRLAGLLLDRTHGLALVETADGTETVDPGQYWREEWVARIDDTGIALASRAGGARRLMLEEAAR
jgi:hypothetical protein